MSTYSQGWEGGELFQKHYYHQNFYLIYHAILALSQKWLLTALPLLDFYSHLERAVCVGFSVTKIVFTSRSCKQHVKTFFFLRHGFDDYLASNSKWGFRFEPDVGCLTTLPRPESRGVSSAISSQCSTPRSNVTPQASTPRRGMGSQNVGFGGWVP